MNFFPEKKEMKQMKKRLSLLLCVLLILTALLATGCEKKQPSQVIDTLDGRFHVDLQKYARDENVDTEDLKNCSCVWEFSSDGQVTIIMTASNAAFDAPEALKAPDETRETFSYTLSDKVDCGISDTVSYIVNDKELLWDHGIVMGTIKSNKTSKGNTTIKLDTPSGSTKTLKGTLSEDGTLFTCNAADNKITGTYTLKEDMLCGEKGVILGTVENKDITGSTATLTVISPDGSRVSYTGAYMPELKVGNTSFSYEYIGTVLTVRTTKRAIDLIKD